MDFDRNLPKLFPVINVLDHFKDLVMVNEESIVVGGNQNKDKSKKKLLRRINENCLREE